MSVLSSLGNIHVAVIDKTIDMSNSTQPICLIPIKTIKQHLTYLPRSDNSQILLENLSGESICHVAVIHLTAVLAPPVNLKVVFSSVKSVASPPPLQEHQDEKDSGSQETQLDQPKNFTEGSSQETTSQDAKPSALGQVLDKDIEIPPKDKLTLGSMNEEEYPEMTNKFGTCFDSYTDSNCLQSQPTTLQPDLPMATEDKTGILENPGDRRHLHIHMPNVKPVSKDATRSETLGSRFTDPDHSSTHTCEVSKEEARSESQTTDPEHSQADLSNLQSLSKISTHLDFLRNQFTNTKHVQSHSETLGSRFRDPDHSQSQSFNLQPLSEDTTRSEASRSEFPEPNNLLIHSSNPKPIFKDAAGPGTLMSQPRDPKQPHVRFFPPCPVPVTMVKNFNKETRCGSLAEMCSHQGASNIPLKVSEKVYKEGTVKANTQSSSVFKSVRCKLTPRSGQLPKLVAIGRRSSASKAAVTPTTYIIGSEIGTEERPSITKKQKPFNRNRVDNFPLSHDSPLDNSNVDPTFDKIRMAIENDHSCYTKPKASGASKKVRNKTAKSRQRGERCGCLKCGHNSIHYGNLFKHIIKCHMKTVPSKCADCGEEIRSAGAFQYHQLKHKQVKRKYKDTANRRSSIVGEKRHTSNLLNVSKDHEISGTSGNQPRDPTKPDFQSSTPRPNPVTLVKNFHYEKCLSPWLLKVKRKGKGTSNRLAISDSRTKTDTPNLHAVSKDHERSKTVRCQFRDPTKPRIRSSTPRPSPATLVMNCHKEKCVSPQRRISASTVLSQEQRDGNVPGQVSVGVSEIVPEQVSEEGAAKANEDTQPSLVRNVSGESSAHSDQSLPVVWDRRDSSATKPPDIPISTVIGPFNEHIDDRPLKPEKQKPFIRNQGENLLIENTSLLEGILTGIISSGYMPVASMPQTSNHGMESSFAKLEASIENDNTSSIKSTASDTHEQEGNSMVKSIERDESCRCIKCGDYSICYVNLLTHTVECHMKTVPCICEECGEEIRSAVDFQYHQFKHTEVTQKDKDTLNRLAFTLIEKTDHTQKHMCHICRKTFNSKWLFKTHLIMAHSGEKPACAVCVSKFESESELAAHMKTHTKYKLLTCTLCPKTFKKSILLKQHMLNHTAAKVHRCLTCGRTFPAEDLLTEHISEHKARGMSPRVCGICQKSFTSKQNLKRHMLTHTGEKPYTCGTCHRSFSQKSTLTTHRKVHTRPRKYACCKCGEQFTRSTGQKHLCKACETSNDKSLITTCDVCKKVFKTFAALKVHLQRHSSERPYLCSFCGKTFKQSSFYAHVRTHSSHSKSPACCPVCGKLFKNLACLKSHERHKHSVKSDVTV